MPETTAKELREKTSQELLDQLALEKKRLFDATVRGASGEAIQPHEKRQGKRRIAQIGTLLRERQRRTELVERVKELAPQAGEARPGLRQLAASDPKPRKGRIQARRLRLTSLTPADRAAVKLAEAKRKQAALKRDDPGESK